LGGFFLINAQDLDEAIAIAQIPCAQVGTVEIRPVIEVARALMTALNPNLKEKLV